MDSFQGGIRKEIYLWHRKDKVNREGILYSGRSIEIRETMGREEKRIEIREITAGEENGEIRGGKRGACRRRRIKWKS